MSSTQVDLSSYFNFVGIATDGVTFSGGMDSTADFSAVFLHDTETYGEAEYAIGPVTSDNSEDNCIQCNGQSISLTGSCTWLGILATHVSGQTTQSFQVHYSDATSSTVTLSFSDWASWSAYPNETNVNGPMPYRNVNDGTQESGLFYLYGYPIPVDSNKTLTSVTLPNNPTLYLFAMDYIVGDVFTEVGSGGVLGGSGKLTSEDLATNDDYFVTCEDGFYISLGGGITSGDNAIAIYGVIGSGGVADSGLGIVDTSHSSQVYEETGSGGVMCGGVGHLIYNPSKTHALHIRCKLRDKRLFVLCRGGWVPVLTRCNQDITDERKAILCPKKDYRRIIIARDRSTF